MKDQTQSPVYKTAVKNQAPTALPWDHGLGPSGLGDEKNPEITALVPVWLTFNWP